MFELDEEIELASYEDFRDKRQGKFKHKDPNGMHYGVDDEGYMVERRYARKIEPKVYVYICDGSQDRYLISRELADKIKRGDAEQIVEPLPFGKRTQSG